MAVASVGLCGTWCDVQTGALCVDLHFGAHCMSNLGAAQCVTNHMQTPSSNPPAAGLLVAVPAAPAWAAPLPPALHTHAAVPQRSPKGVGLCKIRG
jgi:hypothetical protein